MKLFLFALTLTCHSAFADDFSSLKLRQTIYRDVTFEKVVDGKSVRVYLTGTNRGDGLSAHRFCQRMGFDQSVTDYMSTYRAKDVYTGTLESDGSISNVVYETGDINPYYKNIKCSYKYTWSDWGYCN